MKFLSKTLLLSSLLVALPLTAQAEESGAVISMCAQGQETIEPDMANLSFSLVSKASDKIEAANKANKMQGEASRFVKSRDLEAKIVNQGYQTTQTYDRNNKPNGWQVSQNFVVKTKTLTDLDDMTAKLQGLGLVFEGINFSITKEKIDSLQDGLYKKAFANLQNRMDIITSGVRAKKWEVVSLDMMSNRPCNEAAVQAANVAVSQVNAAMDYGRFGYKGTEILGSGNFVDLKRDKSIAAPTFDAAEQTLQLNLWIQARIK